MIIYTALEVPSFPGGGILRKKLQKATRIFIVQRPLSSMIIISSNDLLSGKQEARIKIMVILNEDAKFVARFYSDSDYSVINCGVNPSDSNSDLGVRFTRKKNLGAKK